MGIDASMLIQQATTLVFNVPKVHSRNPAAVHDFLDTHPEIPLFIAKAWPVLVSHFGDKIEIVLEVIEYPYRNSQPELVAWIHAPGQVNEIVDQLEVFTDGWFTEHMDEIPSTFNFNVEFQ